MSTLLNKKEVRRRLHAVKQKLEYITTVPFYEKGNDIKKYPVIVKPYIGTHGSVGVEIINNENDFSHWLKNHQENISEYIIEKFVKGEEYAIDCTFNNTKCTIEGISWHIKKVDDISDSLYIGCPINHNLECKFFSHKYYSNIKFFLNELYKFLPELGKAKLAHIEIIIEEKENTSYMYLVEINFSRYGELTKKIKTCHNKIRGFCIIQSDENYPLLVCENQIGDEDPLNNDPNYKGAKFFDININPRILTKKWFLQNLYPK